MISLPSRGLFRVLRLLTTHNKQLTFSSIHFTPNIFIRVHIFLKLTTFKLGIGGFPGGTSGKGHLANAGGTRDMGLIPGAGKIQGRRHGNPLQYSYLEH